MTSICVIVPVYQGKRFINGLIQMIENIKNISPEYQSRHSDIKWGKIIGFRNGIVHEYGETDYTIVYQIVTKGISELKELFISELNS